MKVMITVIVVAIISASCFLYYTGHPVSGTLFLFCLAGVNYKESDK